MSITGMGIEPEDMSFGNMSDWADYTTVRKEDIDLLNTSMRFAQDYILKQDELIQWLLQLVTKMEMVGDESTTAVWKAVVKEALRKKSELDAFGEMGVAMLIGGGITDAEQESESTDDDGSRLTIIEAE